MQYLTSLLVATAATSVSGASVPRSNDLATVALSSVPLDLTTQTSFTGKERQQKTPFISFGPYESVELNLDAKLANKALRCQALDSNNRPITVVRGAAVDVTFGDGGKGPWTFKAGATSVKQIICDPAFKQASQNAPAPTGDTSVRVTVSDGNLAIQTAFDKAGLVREEKSFAGSKDPFNTINLALGANVQKKDLRCQVLDKNNRPIKVVRGAAVDITFGDGGKGAWKFQAGNSVITKIVCDPAFKQTSQ